MSERDQALEKAASYWRDEASNSLLENLGVMHMKPEAVFALTQGLVDLLERLASVKSAAAYVAQPTMGLPPGADPELFALDGASEQLVRTALAACIRHGRLMLDELNSSPVSPKEQSGE